MIHAFIIRLAMRLLLLPDLIVMVEIKLNQVPSDTRAIAIEDLKYLVRTYNR